MIVERINGQPEHKQSTSRYVSNALKMADFAVFTIEEEMNMESVDPHYIKAERGCGIENGSDTRRRMKQVYQLANDGFILPFN